MELLNLLKKKLEIKNHITQLQESLTETMGEIEVYVSPEIEKQRTIHGKDTGVITLQLGPVTVKHDIPKKIEWDQSILKEIYKKIEDADDNPEDYIGVKYNVPEKRYSALPAQVQQMFNPARTVKVGKPKLTFKMEG